MTLSCPHCGEPLDVYPDPGGGTAAPGSAGNVPVQDYIEDCAVCCRPIRVRVQSDLHTGEDLVEVTGDI